MTEDEIRAEFESCFLDGIPCLVEKDMDGDYISDTVANSWADYLAGAQMAIKKMTKPEGVE